MQAIPSTSSQGELVNIRYLGEIRCALEFRYPPGVARVRSVPVPFSNIIP